MKPSCYFVFRHFSSLHRPTSSSSTTNFAWLSPCLLVRVLLPLLFAICSCVAYIAEERTWTYSKHLSRDRYPANTLARRSHLHKTHVTWSLSTVMTSSRTRKTFRNLVTECLPKICLRGKLLPTRCLAMAVHVKILSRNEGLINELEMVLKWSCPNRCTIPEFSSRGLKKTTKNLNQVGRCTGLECLQKICLRRDRCANRVSVMMRTGDVNDGEQRPKIRFQLGIPRTLE
jgi:hypothetical protein